MLPSELPRLHRDEILEIMKQYPRLSNIRGTMARGEDTEGSDIAFLVDPAPDAGLLTLADFMKTLRNFSGSLLMSYHHEAAARIHENGEFFLSHSHCMSTFDNRFPKEHRDIVVCHLFPFWFCGGIVLMKQNLIEVKFL